MKMNLQSYMQGNLLWTRGEHSTYVNYISNHVYSTYPTDQHLYWILTFESVLVYKNAQQLHMSR